MLSYITRRLFMLPILILGVTVLIFLLLSLLTPYERAALYVQDVPKRQGAIDAVVEKYGLNDPIHIQYLRFLKDALRGDLGRSMRTSVPVLETIWELLPATLQLTLAGMCVALAI